MLENNKAVRLVISYREHHQDAKSVVQDLVNQAGQYSYTK